MPCIYNIIEFFCKANPNLVCDNLCLEKYYYSSLKKSDCVTYNNSNEPTL